MLLLLLLPTQSPGPPTLAYLAKEVGAGQDSPTLSLSLVLVRPTMTEIMSEASGAVSIGEKRDERLASCSEGPSREREGEREAGRRR